MKRREFIAGLGAVAWPLAARAQQGERVRLVGALNIETASELIKEELVKLGWVEGRNLRTEYRASARDPALLAANAEALVDLHPDVIVAMTGPAIRAVETRTQTIPTVFFGGGDAIDNRYANSVARPLGNLTGFANRISSLGGKYVELLKEAVPNITRIAHVFANAPAPVALSAAIDAAALQLEITIVRIPLGYPIETEVAIRAFAAEPNGALLLTGVLPDPAVFQTLQRQALQHQLLLMSVTGRAVEGVLLAHVIKFGEIFRGVASYVDCILRGAKPSELPVQYPTTFELVVNLKTANAIGVAIPETFLARADEVIE
jgi:putative tryptophan/tyrosine transport system substrate-binding protein